MLPALPRDDFLRLLILKSSTLDQRMSLGQIAFAFGCPRPAHVGEYLYLDAVAVMLTSMLSATGFKKLEVAADAVRDHWDEWLALVACAERNPAFDSRGRQVRSEVFVALAKMLDGTYRVLLGETQEIMEALRDSNQSPELIGFVSMHRVLSALRANARDAKPKIALPERFTIARGEPGYENWRAEIEAYRKRAGARFQAKAKAKTRIQPRRQSQLTGVRQVAAKMQRELA